MNKKILKDNVFNQIKRIIGFVDTDQSSNTFGCADRYYWHYKLHDYYNARFQEASLILAFVYLDKDHFLFQSKKLFKLIEGMVGFWLNNLNNNGSVNEIYPNEQSFCATSFSAYIITEVIILLRLEISAEQRQKLSKVGFWLKNNANWHISNQVAASVLALYNIAILLDKKEFVIESQKRMDCLLKQFGLVGYFPEYEGFDLGYSTITMSCLAMMYTKTKDADILSTLESSESRIKAYFDKNGNYDNMGMSRNTAFVYPFGFKVLGSPIFDSVLNGLEQDLILNPAWLDDRYVIGISNDYLMSFYCK